MNWRLLLINISVLFSLYSCISTLTQGEPLACNSSRYVTQYVNENDIADRMQGNTPVLLSFPGSGSTWTRLLIESATGIYTGSVYEKDSVLPNRPCGLRTAIVSSHTSDVILDANKFLKVSEKPRRVRCRRGMVYNFKRVLFLGRDPFHAILANFQREHEISSTAAGLVSSVSSHSKNDTSSAHVASLLWKNYALVASQEYASAWNSLLRVLFSEYVPGKDILNIRYEDMLDSRLQVAIMEKVVSFLRFPLKFDRLECAFQLNRLYQDNIMILARKTPSLAQQAAGVGREEGDGDGEISTIGDTAGISEAYSTLSTSTLCKIWSNVREYSHHFGYKTLLGNLSCVALDAQKDTNKRKVMPDISPSSVAEEPWKRLFGHDTPVANQTFRRMCYAKYGSPGFIPWTTVVKTNHRPPVLMSFPGSGNTWTRLLIEFATGYFSGSLDVSDSELLKSFQGEKYCSRNNSIIKGHPSDLDWKVNKRTGKTRNVLDFSYAHQRRKCLVGHITGFNRTVFISRDPFPSIYSDYQREFTGSHVGIIGTEGRKFVPLLWRDYAVLLADRYKSKWETLVQPMIRRFGRNGVLALRYEDLINKQKRVDTLGKIVTFMGYKASKEHLECAFVLSERPTVAHRKSIINATYAYAVEGNTDLPCEVWKRVRGFSEYFKYNKWKNVSCRYEECQSRYHSSDNKKPHVERTTSSLHDSNHVATAPIEGVGSASATAVTTSPALLLRFPGRPSDTWFHSLLQEATGMMIGSLRASGTTTASASATGVVNTGSHLSASAPLTACSDSSMLVIDGFVDDVKLAYSGSTIQGVTLKDSTHVQLCNINNGNSILPSSTSSSSTSTSTSKTSFQKVLFLVRNPYDTIFEDLCHRHYPPLCSLTVANLPDWRDAIVKSSEVYASTWSSLLKPLIDEQSSSSKKDKNNTGSTSSSTTTASTPTAGASSVQIKFIRLEDLSPRLPEQQRTRALVDILQFLGSYSTTTRRSTGTTLSAANIMDRIRCAYYPTWATYPIATPSMTMIIPTINAVSALEKLGRIHGTRKFNKGSELPVISPYVPLNYSHSYPPYHNAVPVLASDLACDIWRNIGNYSAYFSYNNNISVSGKDGEHCFAVHLILRRISSNDKRSKVNNN